MDTIDSSIRELSVLLHKKAPHLRPSIYPSQFTARSIRELCVNETQEENMRSFFRAHDIDEEYASMHTDVDFPNRKVIISKLNTGDNPLDSQIQSLEYMMRAFVSGNEEELNILTTRFLQANGYHQHNGNADDDEHGNQSYVLQEVCNIAYSIKIALSNVPNVNVYLSDKILPLNENDDIEVLLHTITKRNVADADSDVDSGSDEEKKVKQPPNKIRKKKRGGSGKGKQ
jgi:hypothetical protein